MFRKQQKSTNNKRTPKLILQFSFKSQQQEFMRNDTIDFQNLKRTKLINPLFEHCSKAIPIHSLQHNPLDISDIKKTFSYVVVPNKVEMDQRVFQCKSLCPIFNCGSQSFILVKGQNLWDYYRAKKQHEIIMTEQQLWILVKQIITALIELQSYGYFHSHLKQYAIYRQSPFSYQLIYHPQMRSMRELSRSNESYYWYDFYLSPQELKVNDFEGFKETGKETVFALGLMLLNVMNAEDFNRSVYSKARYEVDWNVVWAKFEAVKGRYSSRMIDLTKNCLKEFPEQRYGFKEVLNDSIAAINIEKSRNLQFKVQFHQLMSSKLILDAEKPSPRISDSRQNDFRKSSPKSHKSQSPKSPSPSSKEKAKPIVTSKQKQTTKLKPSPESQKKTDKSFESPPKKWKIPQKKTYSIAKPQNSISKEKQVQKEDFIKKQSVENKPKTGKSLQKREDVINFQRGTFGGEQSSQMSSFSSSKFKKDIKMWIQSNPSESIKDEPKQTFEQDKVDNFENERMIRFGEMKSQQVLNPSNSVDSLDSEIYILDSGRRKQRQKQKEQQNQEIKVVNPFAKPSQQFIPQKIAQQPPSKAYTLEHVKQSSQALQQSKTLTRIQQTLQTYTQQLTLNLNDCLQPLQILQTVVSNSHGVYIQGNIYFGPFKHGRRNGFGLEIFPQNQYYLGNFKDDLFHGEGFYFWNRNQYFLGMFQNGKRVFGHLFGPKLHYFGQFLNSKKMNGFGRAKFKNGQQFVGEWVQGRRSGLGKLTQITKDIFIGHWLKGKRSGYGQHISQNYPQQGYRLKAFWKDSDIISQVIIEYDNGNLYQGSLNQQLEKHGKGQFTFKKGGYFKGTFYENNATHGELVYRNGEKYVGCLKNMKRHGFGEYHYLDGTVKKGNWVEDIRIQKDTDVRGTK